jgi:hypothetical protein
MLLPGVGLLLGGKHRQILADARTEEDGSRTG